MAYENYRVKMFVKLVDCDPEILNSKESKNYLGFCLTSSPNLMLNIKNEG